MASIYQLKPAFQSLLRPVVRQLARAGVTPNQVTVAALVLSFGAGAVVAVRPTASWPLLVLPAALFVRMALNALDGMLARGYGMTTPAGAVLNEMGDVVADAAMYLPLALVPGVAPGWLVVAVVLGVFTEMAGVLGAVLGGARRYDGPMGKSDRAFVFAVVSLLLGLGLQGGVWVTVVLAAMCALLVLTVLRRARRATAPAVGGNQ